MKSTLLRLLAADLVHKLGKAGGVGQVDVGIRLHAMAVATGRSATCSISRPAGEPRGSHPSCAGRSVPAREESRHSSAGTRLPGIHASRGPTRKRSQRGWLKTTSTLGSSFSAARISVRRAVTGIRGIVRERLHPLGGAGAGQVVDAEMKILHAAVGRAPLHRDRNPPRAGHGAQQHGRVDVVVVGDGNHGAEIERLNLLAFQVECQLAASWAGSNSGSIVDAQCHVSPVRGSPGGLETGE